MSIQTSTEGGVTYTTTTVEENRAVTASKVHYTQHGTCQIFGTSRTGSGVVRGFNTAAKPVDITVT